jgi:RNA polymerase sigma factor (sigma-70 family)
VRREVAQLSDEALLEAVADDDEAALGELYDRFGRTAYSLAFRILRDASLAEDAVQEAFLQAWRGAAGYRAERAKASTWLLTFVHRRAVDLVRREERRRTEPVEALTDPTGPGADVEAARGSRRQIVRAALQALPSEQRQAIELAYFGGLTQSELADRLGQPLGTIKSRIFTGLNRLRGLLAEADFDQA